MKKRKLGVVSVYKAKKQIESSSDGKSVFWDSVATKCTLHTIATYNYTKLTSREN